MPITLDSTNIFEYLNKLGYCRIEDRDATTLIIIPAKNFNLLVILPDRRQLLVKQEPQDGLGRTQGEFHYAWRMQRLVDTFPHFSQQTQAVLPEILHFDPENSIAIVNFLVDYLDLYRYYTQQERLPTDIAPAIGSLIGKIHRETYQREEYRCFLSEPIDLGSPPVVLPSPRNSALDIIDRLGRVTPEIFQTIPIDCLQFFKLYQRFPSLAHAISDLSRSLVPSCLIHNDLKINNILIDLNWQNSSSTFIRFIDWERADWGDPAFDLGCLLGSYLEIWLDGLAVDKSIGINESLQLAKTPLELLQPSLAALIETYLATFPQIALVRPDFLDRVIQFAGLALIQRVEITIDSDRVFSNRGILMLQVAKQLLCTPQTAVTTIFGRDLRISAAPISHPAAP